MLILKIPWVDRGKCDRKLDCPAARVCPKGALVVGRESSDEQGHSAEYPLVDLERCRQCGDCAKACPEGALKMV